MRIGKPLMLTITPIGITLGFIEAWQFGRWLAALMLAMMLILGFATWQIVSRVRAEHRHNRTVSSTSHT
jgi:hypothetical protein